MDNPAPPMTSPPPLPNNSSGTGPTGAFLAKFNEKAMQLGGSLEWNATKAGGTAHQPTWKVDCKGEYSRFSDWLSGDAKIFSPSRWNAERHGSGKKQATGERRGCASCIPSPRLVRGCMRSIAAVSPLRTSCGVGEVLTREQHKIRMWNRLLEEHSVVVLQ